MPGPREDDPAAAGATTVRGATPGDAAAVREVVRAAFGRDDEAALVERLRDGGSAALELVAVDDGGRAVGHVLFSHLPIATKTGGVVPAAALAPLAVLPERQRAGIGGRLVRAGIEGCRGLGLAAVVVLGDSGYYARFGFSAATARHLETPFPGPAFMALELTPGAFAGATRVRYAPAFGLDS